MWKCALQVNPWSYNAEFQGKQHGLSEDKYNEAIVQSCINHGIQGVGIADHGCVGGVANLRNALESAGVVVLPGFEIANTEKVHMGLPVSGRD